ncbi:Aldo/keto reductase [Athelia psychrophila]|uniref:Aldo/keto reductase n=1 Tax=Athelia psychrophila TaxID=1759441 RepID=A0A166SRA5_9AGAM|nr:Aldo/keto reductase [Fibularhizoctonia sp. CBS 109695]
MEPPDWQSWVFDEEESIKHVKAAYDAGINIFDSADVYSNGASEVALGKAIKAHNLPREEIKIMTKLFMTVGRTAPSILDVRPPALDADHYLQLDYVDVLQCHRFDNESPIEETMQALHDVVKAGYARYIGMLPCLAWQFHAMQNYAVAHNLTPFISMQNHYSLVYREEEREMMPTLKVRSPSPFPFSFSLSTSSILSSQFGEHLRILQPTHIIQGTRNYL